MRSNTAKALVLIFYTDPGSGLLIWQVLAASALGVMFYARNTLRRLWARIRHTDKTEEKSSSSSESES
jgi:hypothetical protein